MHKNTKKIIYFILFILFTNNTNAQNKLSFEGLWRVLIFSQG